MPDPVNSNTAAPAVATPVATPAPVSSSIQGSAAPAAVVANTAPRGYDAGGYEGESVGGGNAPSPTAATPINWEARYTQENEQRTAMERDLDSYRTRFDGIDSDAARAAIARSSRPEDPFDDGHPEFASNLRRAEMAADWLADLETMTEDERKVYGPKLAQRRGITSEDVRLAGLHKRRLEGNARTWHQNPAKAFQEHFDKQAEKLEQKIFQKLTRERTAEKWINDPARSAVRDHAPAVAQVFDASIPFAERTEYVANLHAKIAKYEAALGTNAREAATADAQAAARSINTPANRTADGERRRPVDAVEYVKQHYKLTAENPQFSQRLLEVNAKIRAGQL